MKHLTKVSLLAMAFFLSATAFAQKVKLQEGSLDLVKAEKAYNFEFTWNNTEVGKYKTEAEYKAKKVEEYNKKEAGKGDTWSKRWEEDKTTQFEPKFIEQFNSNAKTEVVADAKYTIIVNTTSMEPGYNVGVSRKNAEVDLEVTIVETADKSKVVAKITIKNSPGRTFGGYDFDTGGRISEAYAKAGKELAKYIK